MKILLKRQFDNISVQLDEPVDISIPLIPGEQGVNCFYAPWPEAWPVESGDFIGDTRKGGAVNFFNLKVNPHGNGTHTECVGHIAHERINIYESLRRFHFFARLASVYPRKQENGDRIIALEDVREIIAPESAEALILRTMPNDARKCRMNYSGTNPPYISADAMQYIVDCGIMHLLVDLPSVDREEDGGKLAAHRIFWQYPGPSVRKECTITELIYVGSAIPDGDYLLNLQVASLFLDAVPSKPVLYRITESGKI
jgi:arylformamidase